MGLVCAAMTLWTATAMADPGDRVSQGDMVIGAHERVGDAVTFGGSLTILGKVTGDAVAFGGDVHLMPGARVDGDITAFDGSIVVEPGAEATGARTAFGDFPGGAATIDGGGGSDIVGAGSTATTWFEQAQAQTRALLSHIGHMVGLYAILVILGMVMLGVAPLRTRALAAAVAAHPGKSLGYGLLVVLVSALALLILSVTVVGIPVAAILAVGLGIAVLLGLTGVSILIGELLPFESLKDRQFLKLAAGAGALVLALAIPYAGGVIGVIATILGLGSLAFTRMRPGHAVFGGGKGPYRTAAHI